MPPQSHRAETAFAFSAHPDPATAVGEVLGIVQETEVMTTTVLGLFAGSWPSGSRRLAWLTVCRLLQPEVAVAGAVPEILHPRSDSPVLSDRRQHRSLALIATDTGPAEIVADEGVAEPAAGSGPAIIFNGWDVVVTGDTSRPRFDNVAHLEPAPPTGPPSRRFLSVHTVTAVPAIAAVRFDPTEVSLEGFQGVRTLRDDLAAIVKGREITSIDNRPGLDVIDELTAGVGLPDLRPEALLIGTGDRWHRVVAVDRAVGSLILAATPENTVGQSVTMGGRSTVTVAVPDLVDAMIAVRQCIGPGQRPLLTVASHYVRQPNEIGADQDVDDVAGDLAPLIVPSPGLMPGAVQAVVFGAQQVR